MKKILALLLAGCMALALCACGTPAEPADETGSGGDANASANGDTVVIGVFEPLSGDNGAGGKQEVLGMQYANAETPTVDIGGKTYNVKLEVVDNESSNDKAVSAASNLISKNVSIILGSYGSGVSIAASDTFAQAKIPAVGVPCTNPQITEGNDHSFRICFLDPFQGTVLANFAKDELKAEKVYCLGQLGNDYDQGLMNYFKQAAEKLGMECVVESFPKNNSDFTSYLTTAKNEGADVIFAPTSISYAQLIVEQAAAQGIDMPLLASDTWDSNVILGAAKGKDVKVYVTTFYAEGGAALLPQAQQIVALADSCLRHFQMLREGVGTLRLQTIPLLIIPTVTRLCRQFKQANPGCDFEFSTGMSSQVCQSVIQGKADIGFCSKILPDPQLVYAAIQRRAMVAAVPLDHPLARQDTVTLEETLPYPHVTYSWLSGQRDPVDRLFAPVRDRWHIAY